MMIRVGRPIFGETATVIQRDLKASVNVSEHPRLRMRIGRRRDLDGDGEDSALSVLLAQRHAHRRHTYLRAPGERDLRARRGHPAS